MYCSAGITGITLAYLLRDSGLKIALIDSDQVIHGTTAYTTAKLTAGQGLIYQDLIQNIGYDGAKLYYESQQEAIDFVAKTIHDLKIDCDFVRLPTMSLPKRHQTYQNLRQNMKPVVH